EGDLLEVDEELGRFCRAVHLVPDRPGHPKRPDGTAVRATEEQRSELAQRELRVAVEPKARVDLFAVHAGNREKSVGVAAAVIAIGQPPVEERSQPYELSRGELPRVGIERPVDERFVVEGDERNVLLEDELIAAVDEVEHEVLEERKVSLELL